MTALAELKERAVACLPLAAGAWTRYALATAATVGINASLALLLQYAGTPALSAPEPPETMELNVVDMETESPAPTAEPETASPVCFAEEPALPAPALPMLELPALAATPNALRLPAAAGVPALELACTVPAVEPAPVPAAVALPTAPAGGSGSHGPILVEPPNPAMYYPYSARQRGITGDTLIAVTVGADGKVRAVEVLGGSPRGVFEQAARRLGLSLQFEPARRGGAAVPARVRLNLHWELD